LDLLHLYTELGTTGNTALSLMHTIYSSSLHPHENSETSIVVSRQRIYSGLTVTSNYTWILLSQPNFFLAIIVQLRQCEYSTEFSSCSPKLMSREAGVLKLCPSLHVAVWCQILLYNHFAWTTQKTLSVLLRRSVY
jgi:hypothetical protein